MEIKFKKSSRVYIFKCHRKRWWWEQCYTKIQLNSTSSAVTGSRGCGKRDASHTWRGIRQSQIDIRTTMSRIRKVVRGKSNRRAAPPPRVIGARREGKTPASMKHIRETLIFQKRTGERVSPTTHRMTVTQMERRLTQFRERAQPGTTRVRASTSRQSRALLVAVVLVWFTIGYYCAQCSEWAPAAAPCMCRFDTCGWLFLGKRR